ncbi:hypothetical protein [Dehalobacter sp. TBBPA1]|uniref:hypothetical protein n=1 Tax=Dehalobacter sp. TBBPA1 TaxID=3235037 RepID=UPI0034A4F866
MTILPQRNLWSIKSEVKMLMPSVAHFNLAPSMARRSLSLLAIHGIATLEHPCSLKTAQREKQNAKCESKDNEMAFKF